MVTQLPLLLQVERLSPLVIRILGGNPSKFTLQGTNTYLVGRGSQRILIDTAEGLPIWRTALAALLASEAAVISQCILTHWHHDHVGGVPDLLCCSPGAKIYKAFPSSSTTQLDIQNGQIFSVEGASLRAFHCPGHTNDHVALILEEESAMFTGDNVLGHGTAVFEDLATYMKSLESMEGEFSGRAYPGHGAVIEDGKKRVREYRTHRAQRELQVLRELGRRRDEGGGRGTDPKSSMEIVRIVYKDIPENLHQPAEGGVIQVLTKLMKEGRVTKDVDGRWRTADTAGL